MSRIGSLRNSKNKYKVNSLTRFNTVDAIPEIEESRIINSPKRVIEVDEECWRAMIDLAENYYYQKQKKRISYATKKFGDRFIILLCQLWYDENTPNRFILRLKK